MDVYERLIKKIDSVCPIPTPQTESKLEVKILREILTPEDAEVLLQLSGEPEDLPTIAARIGMEPEKLQPILDAIVAKGGCFKLYQEPPLYFLIPMVPGIYEFQVNRVSPEAFGTFMQYYTEALAPAVFSNKTAFGRVVPVKKSVTAETNVLVYDEVDRLIDGASAISLVNCICRTNAAMVGKSCGRPAASTCIALDTWAELYNNNGFGKSATREEAKAVLRQAEDAGLVHVTMNAKAGSCFICNCCGCCCGQLAAINALKLPNAVAHSNYVVELDPEKCIACGDCVERCQVGALALDGSVVSVALERCIGCGLCVSTCPSDALSMRQRAEEVHIPQDPGSMMVEIAQGRG